MGCDVQVPHTGVVGQGQRHGRLLAALPAARGVRPERFAAGGEAVEQGADRGHGEPEAIPAGGRIGLARGGE